MYVGSGGPIDWKAVKVPDTVRVSDMRMESAPASVKEGGVIRGGVFDMATHRTITGAKVVLFQPKVSLVQGTEAGALKQPGSTQTDKAGLFEISAIPEGYYQIHVYAEGYAARAVGAFDNRSGHACLESDILISKAAPLRGVVADEKGNPIPGVKVSARNAIGMDGFGYGPAKAPSATTDAKGCFEISSLPEGSTGLFCQAPSLHQQTSIFELYKVSNRPWEKREDIRIVMTGTGSVRGKVVDRDGKAPTREFSVNIEPKGGSKRGSWSGSMRCKEGGTFEFSGVPPGEYVLVAQPNPMTEGEASEPKPVVITTGCALEVELVTDHAQK